MYILGVFRRTALWGIILSILGMVAMGSTDWLFYIFCLSVVYILFALLHIGICKLKHRSDTAGEIYLSALGYDLVAPFTKIGTFIAVITKRWIIHDDSVFHDFVDGLQVVTGGLWSLCVWAITIYFIIIIVA